MEQIKPNAFASRNYVLFFYQTNIVLLELSLKTKPKLLPVDLTTSPRARPKDASETEPQLPTTMTTTMNTQPALHPITTTIPPSEASMAAERPTRTRNLPRDCGVSWLVMRKKVVKSTHGTTNRRLTRNTTRLPLLVTMMRTLSPLLVSESPRKNHASASTTTNSDQPLHLITKRIRIIPWGESPSWRTSHAVVSGTCSVLMTKTGPPRKTLSLRTTRCARHARWRPHPTVPRGVSSEKVLRKDGLTVKCAVASEPLSRQSPPSSESNLW